MVHRLLQYAAFRYYKSKATARADWKDVVTLTIPARGNKEYKLLLAKGSKLKYLWEINGAELFYDFHGEPTGDKTGYFKSFKKNTESTLSGELIASFDGTKEFVKKNDEFTVNIELIHKDTPVLGVVYAPALDICYWAKQGEGAFKDGQRFPIKTVNQRNTYKIVVSRSHMSDETQAFIDTIRH